MITDERRIPGSEIADLFRKAIRGEAKLELAGNRTWDDVYCGNVEFRICGYKVVAFNDCFEFDYVDSAESPDGRRGDFDAWFDAGEEPASLLNERELAELQLLAESSVPSPPEEEP